jgi:Holliday junction resolvase
MARRPYRRPITPENAAKGAAAEELFKAWLNHSRLPFLYTTQDLESVPAHFRGVLKRPDFVVAVPYVATICFEVKAKSLYEGHFIFDQSEIEGLILFDAIFRLTTFIACIDPDDPSRSWWFRAAKLAALPSGRKMGVMTVQAAISDGLEVDMNDTLQEALHGALLLG